MRSVKRNTDLKNRKNRLWFALVCGACLFAGSCLTSYKTVFASQTGWIRYGGDWKYLEQDQSPHLGWLNVGKEWYYLDATEGTMKVGWYLAPDKKWYYLDTRDGQTLGMMLKGWQWIDGFCYYFDVNSGRMFADEKTADGYTLNQEGHCMDSAGNVLFESGKGLSTINTDKVSKNTGRTAGRAGASSSSGGGSGSSTKRSSSTRTASDKNKIENQDKWVNRQSDAVYDFTENHTAEALFIPYKQKDDSINDVKKADDAVESAGYDNNQNFDIKKRDDKANSSGDISARADIPKASDSNTKLLTDTSGKNQRTDSEQPSSGDTDHSDSSRINTDSEIGNDSLKNKDSSGEDSSQSQPPKNEDASSQDNGSADDISHESQADAIPNEDTGMQEKAELIYEQLRSGKNKNVAQYTDRDGNLRSILWVQGIVPPVMGENGDFHEDIIHAGGHVYINYTAEQSSGSSWFDVNKASVGSSESAKDRNLCFAATAANMLHWWMTQNLEYIEQFEQEKGDVTRQIGTIYYTVSSLKDSFVSQQESALFEMFKSIYGYRTSGFNSDILADFFINGYTPKQGGGTNLEDENLQPDSRGGFFYEVFGGQKLTQRSYRGNYNDLSNFLKEALSDGNIVGIEHSLFGGSNHIITLWGAEYDENGKLTAVYVTDSDDQSDDSLGMKRYMVNNSGGRAKLTTNISDRNAGSAVNMLHSLSLGTEQWQKYFSK